MGKEKKKRKHNWQMYIIIVFYILVGALCGFLVALFEDSINGADKVSGGSLQTFIFLMLGIYLSIFLNIIIHEGGHLIFGLLTGYQFSSFSVIGFMWVKQNGKVRFRRLSIAGMGGQCLMAPPDMVNDKMPFVLYHMGGAIMNIVCGLVFLWIFFLCNTVSFLSIFLLIASIMGFAFALMNGMPMRLGTINNDGSNALSLRNNSKALRSIWIQLKANEQMVEGVRLKDMPAEWFTVPDLEGMKNSMTAVIGVFACNQMMDEHAFIEANKLMQELLHMDTAIVGLHRSLLICDRVYCELVAGNELEKIQGMLDKRQIKFMKAMKNFPAIMRTEYAYALLVEKDTEKAEKIKTRFEKCARNYPYPRDMECERELMKIVEEKQMIRKIDKSELPACLDVIRKSNATVAESFGLTEANCPGHTSFMKMEKLEYFYDSGFYMFGLYEKGELIGYFSLSQKEGSVYELHNLSVLPEYRHLGFGKRLLDSAKERVIELGGTTIAIGIIEDNAILKKWYEQNDFCSTGTKRFDHLPFLVGFMEWNNK